MNLVYLFVPVALLAASVIVTYVLVKKGMSAKKAMAVHLLSLMAITVVSMALPLGASAETADASANTTAAQTTDTATEAKAGADNGLKYIGAALSVGIAAIGGGVAVAAGAPAAIGANVEDPKSFGKSLIFVALGEGFGLYGVLVGVLCLVL